MNGSQNKSQERIGKEFCLHRGFSEIAQAKIRSGPWPGYFTTCYGLSSLRSLAQKNRRPQNILRKRRPCYDRWFRMGRQMAGWGEVWLLVLCLNLISYSFNFSILLSFIASQRKAKTFSLASTRSSSLTMLYRSKTARVR